MAARLDKALWVEIQRRWEFDPDSPTFLIAAARAAKKHGFTSPGKTAVYARAHRENWQRRGSMAGVVQAAHAKADALVDGGEAKKGGVESSTNAQLAREEGEALRAEIIARHRREWVIVRTLLDEALKHRATDIQGAFDRAKLAKISAETTAIQQIGERRSWGMDEQVNVGDLSRMSDAELEALARGKLPR
jgi:hypothetical protein